MEFNEAAFQGENPYLHLFTIFGANVPSVNHFVYTQTFFEAIDTHVRGLGMSSRAYDIDLHDGLDLTTPAGLVCLFSKQISCMLVSWIRIAAVFGDGC